MYNFNIVGTALSFRLKLIKHMNNNNAERVKDYICAAFDYYDPTKINSHPCLDIIKEAYSKTLHPKGWKCTIANWKEEGKQFILKSPDNNYYRSHYKHIK